MAGYGSGASSVPPICRRSPQKTDAALQQKRVIQPLAEVHRSRNHGDFFFTGTNPKE